MGRIDILTGTLGKALGGASGGYTAGRQEMVDWLRQRSRPYLFSNTLLPAICARVARPCSTCSSDGDELRAAAQRQRRALPGRHEQLPASRWPAPSHPIIPVMLGDATLAQEMAGADARRAAST